MPGARELLSVKEAAARAWCCPNRCTHYRPIVRQNFNEWFANCTLETIRKNLRTTTGRRKIEICEKLL